MALDLLFKGQPFLSIFVFLKGGWGGKSRLLLMNLISLLFLICSAF